MNDPVDIRLNAIEHQLHFFAEGFKQLQSTILKGVKADLNRELVDVIRNNLSSTIREFKDNVKELHEISQELRNDSILRTLKFMAKETHEIKEKIVVMEEEGVKKNIHLGLTLDGYQMVKRKVQFKEVDAEEPEDAVQALLDTLTIKERTTLIHRFGLFNEKKKTLDHIAGILKLTREPVRVIIAKALRKCRHPSRRNLVSLLTHSDLLKAITGDSE